MKAAIEIDRQDLRNAIQEMVRFELSQIGLLAFIKEEIVRQFHSWQNCHVSYETRFKNLETKIARIAKGR